MLPRINRLTKKKDFETVFKKGRGIRENSLVLKFLMSNLENSRFGFVISQKISKKATLRNKIKRRLREIVRCNLPKIKKGIDGVIVALPGLEEKDFHEMEGILKKIFSKAGLFKNRNVIKRNNS